MRIVSIGEASTCRHYRSKGPLEALTRRGHHVTYREPPAESRQDASNRPSEIQGFDLILGYRMLLGNVRIVRQEMARGAAFVWDVDDDLSQMPRDSKVYKEMGKSGMRFYSRHLGELARMADVVTTTSPVLADKYARLGAKHVAVIDNHLLHGTHMKVKRSRRKELTVGWVAGGEHKVDAKRVPIVTALREILEDFPNVRIETAGVQLRLPEDRYQHYSWVNIAHLPKLLARWDVGIAPLTDIPFNRARSDVKLKEYGACGLPWLASPVGPYAGKTEAQGGRLVADDEWYDALAELLDDGSARKRLGDNAYKWSETQAVRHNAEQWEQVCLEAVERSSRRRG